MSMMRGRRMRRISLVRGFTLVELMIVVVILAILSSLAAPAFSELIASQRVRAGASGLYESLILARSEAIKRNASVSLTPTSGNLGSGWRVLLADGATSIRSQEALTRTNFNPVAPDLAFSSLGRLVSGATTTIVVSGDGTTKEWRVIAEPSGRICVVDGGTTC